MSDNIFIKSINGSVYVPQIKEYKKENCFLTIMLAIIIIVSASFIIHKNSRSINVEVVGRSMEPTLIFR